jgi:hypothetical protein
MSKADLIQQTILTLEKLPAEKVSEVSDFAEYLFKKFEEETLQNGITQIVTDSGSFQFLQEEQELYTTKDLKEKYK